MLSAFYVCCIYSSVLETIFLHESKEMNPDQTVPLAVRKQSDLGPYFQKISRQEEQTTNVVTVDSKAIADWANDPDNLSLHLAKACFLYCVKMIQFTLHCSPGTLSLLILTYLYIQ